MPNVLTKDPGSVLDFTHDWTTEYLDSNEVIDIRQWMVAPHGELIIDSGAAEETVFVSGGVAGHTYQLTERVTTSAGRVVERAITIRVQDR